MWFSQCKNKLSPTTYFCCGWLVDCCDCLCWVVDIVGSNVYTYIHVCQSKFMVLQKKENNLLFDDVFYEETSLLINLLWVGSSPVDWKHLSKLKKLICKHSWLIYCCVKICKQIFEQCLEKENIINALYIIHSCYFQSFP